MKKRPRMKKSRVKVLSTNFAKKFMRQTGSKVVDKEADKYIINPKAYGMVWL